MTEATAVGMLATDHRLVWGAPKGTYDIARNYREVAMSTDGYAWMTIATRHVKVDSDAHFAVKRRKASAREKINPRFKQFDQYLEFWIRLG